MKTHVREAVNGLRLEYPEPDAKLARFLSEVERAAANPEVTHDELVGLIYGERNPILERSPLGTPWATDVVVANPVFAVMKDLLERKHIEQRGDSPEKLAKAYTLTATEAAERLGISASAVRQAVAKKRLAVWVRDGEYRFHPKWVEQYGRLRTSGVEEELDGKSAPRRRSSQGVTRSTR